MRDRRGVALLGLLLIALPVPVAAQSVAEARARAERLLEAYQADQAAALRVNQEDMRRRQSDTVEAGALRVVVRQADRPLVESAANLAWPTILGRYGSPAESLTKHPIFVYAIDSTANEFGVSAVFPDGSITSQSVGAGASRSIADGLVRYVDMLLWANADSALRAWYPSTPDPGLDSAVTAERVYLELVTSLSVQARSCLVGDDRACSEALGLREISDPLITSFDPAGRRALATRLPDMREGPHMVTRYRDCVDEADDAACVEVLRAALAGPGSYDAFRLPPAVGDGPRRALVAQVQRLGGPEAWRRLLESAGQPLEARLALAARVPPDSLMRVWRRGLIAARPTAVTVSTTSLLMALLWFGVGLAFALRFSRWY
jgi:hypothetical protein